MGASSLRTPHSALRAPLFVISGPSGVGKTTLVDALLGRTSLPLRRAITATTRDPRPGEVPDLSYHFWTREQFQEAIARDEMLERAQVHRRDFYGTPRSEVDPYRDRGVGVILVIDVQGAGEIRLAYPDDHRSIFIAPPTFDDLERRLRGRQESEDSIRLRLETARAELERQDEYDEVLVNDDIETATTRLEAIMRDEFKRRGF